MHELFARGAFVCRKFARSISNIGRATNGADDPLPEIPLEVEEKIADAVRLLVRSPPEHLGRKRADGLPQFDPILVGQIGARAVDEVLADVHS